MRILDDFPKRATSKSASEGITLSPCSRFGLVKKIRPNVTIRHLILLLFIAVLASPLTSQEKKQPEKKVPPKVLYAVPLVVKAGVKQKLALRGNGLADAKEIEVVGVKDATIKVFGGKAAAVPNNYPGDRLGDSEVEFELELPKDAKPGEVKLIAIGPGGKSNPYTLLLRDELPAVAEKEPNDGFEQAQTITIPAAIEGTIKAERDVDVFKFEAKKGDKLRIEIQAARYGSPLSAMLTLHDADRRIIDSASETAENPDPILNVTVQKTGTYYIGAIDANDLGGSNFGYRLIVHSFK